MLEHRGLHHISVMASDPQQNYDFYVKKLGMRMVKKTVNQDDPTKYHLFYGNSEGTPGSSLTFFPWPGARGGSPGTGEATAVSLAVPEDSLSYWKERMSDRKTASGEPVERFGKKTLSFKDPDGLQLHLVFDDRIGELEDWSRSSVPKEHRIQGFWSTTISLDRPEETTDILTSILGFSEAGSEDNAILYQTESNLGHSVIVEKAPQKSGRNGAGIVHHVAFQTRDDEDLEALRQRVKDFGLEPTDIIDRHFFKSVYFRTPGGVLFEMATHGPGYFVNADPFEDQAEHLDLTPWHEPQREKIEGALPPINT